MRPLLAVMHPRNIRPCVESIEALDVPTAWMDGFTEWGLRDAMRDLIADQALDFDHLALVSDDCVIGQEALDAVLDLCADHPVVTGYTRLDSTHPLVNITRSPLRGDAPGVGAYDWYSHEEASTWPDEVIPTGFAGFALTAMSRDMWERFPFDAFGGASSSWASDFHLSARLRDAGVPIVAARAGYIEHVKEVWNRLDRDPAKRLLVGTMPARVRIESGSPASA